MKDPITFSEKGGKAYTNYKVEVVVESESGHVKCFSVYHRYTHFERLKNKLEEIAEKMSKQNQFFRLPSSQFPSKPWIPYGQFQANFVEWRAEKLESWLREAVALFIGAKSECREMREEVLLFLLEGELDKDELLQSVDEMGELFKLPFKSSLSLSKEVKEERHHSPAWFNLKSFGVLIAEANSANYNYHNNANNNANRNSNSGNNANNTSSLFSLNWGSSSPSFRLIVKPKRREPLFLKIATASRREDILSAFFALKNLFYKTLKLKHSQIAPLLPLSLQAIHENWEHITSSGSPLL